MFLANVLLASETTPRRRVLYASLAAVTNSMLQKKITPPAYYTTITLQQCVQLLHM